MNGNSLNNEAKGWNYAFAERLKVQGKLLKKE